MNIAPYLYETNANGFRILKVLDIFVLRLGSALYRHLKQFAFSINNPPSTTDVIPANSRTPPATHFRETTTNKCSKQSSPAKQALAPRGFTSQVKPPGYLHQPRWKGHQSPAAPPITEASDHERITNSRTPSRHLPKYLNPSLYITAGTSISNKCTNRMNSRQNNHSTPTPSERSTPANSQPPSLSSSWSVPMTVSHAVTGLLRRFSTETPTSKTLSPISSPTFSQDGVYTPPYRTASPFQPPPLYPVSLRGYKEGTPQSAKLLTKSLAEEIRLLVPPRLQLCEDWNLVYSLEEDGVSLGTLYKKCDELRGLRNGFVLIVKDGEGGLFGAYLTEAPHPNPHYFGTGECFLWRATNLSPHAMPTNLPPPPSTDTTNMTRSTTISSHPQSHNAAHLSPLSPNHQNHQTFSSSSSSSLNSFSKQHSPIITPLSPASSLRFKAFPYSGVNDYMMLCDPRFLSVGGGDGHYGLWLDDTFEKGISSHCLTFGNEPLSEEGEKFEILGVEVWSLGNTI